MTAMTAMSRIPFRSFRLVAVSFVCLFLFFRTRANFRGDLQLSTGPVRENQAFAVPYTVTAYITITVREAAGAAATPAVPPLADLRDVTFKGSDQVVLGTGPREFDADDDKDEQEEGPEPGIMFHQLFQWDWRDSEEEELCRHPESTKSTSDSDIPKTVHFVILSSPGEQSSLTYTGFLAIKSAILRIKPDAVKLHVYRDSFDTTNSWWKQLKTRVSLIPHERSALKLPSGLVPEDVHLAHQSDILRLDIMIQEGGIYLDTDIFALKSFDELLRNHPRDAIMGHEGGSRVGLCNAIIIAKPNATFLQKWQDSYKTFNPKKWEMLATHWNEHSVIMPKTIHLSEPELVCPLSPTVFFWPTFDPTHVRYMHKRINDMEQEELRRNMAVHGGVMYANQLAIHGWGKLAPELTELTPRKVLRRDTRFNILLRDIARAEL